MENLDIDKRKVKFSDALLPGVVISAVFIIFSLLMDLFVENLEMKQKVGYISWLLIIPILFYYTNNFRKNEMDGFLSYKDSFLYLFFITIIYSIAFSIFTYINFSIISPELIDQMLIEAENQLYQQDQLSQEQIDQAYQVQKMIMKPGWLTIMSFFSSVIFGTILNLILSIFLKKEKPIEAE